MEESNFLRIVRLLAFTLTLFIGTTTMGAVSKTVPTSRIKQDFGLDWYFQKGQDTIAKNWSKISIPHTTNIEPLVVNHQWQGTSWYKKAFTLNKTIASRRYYLYFEGVMQESVVWVNGEQITAHVGGYLPFTVEITKAIDFNKPNEIIVKVDNSDNQLIPPGKKLDELDFNLYGGIYRNVHLISTNPIYITEAIDLLEPNTGGISIRSSGVSQEKAKLLIKTHVQNESGSAASIYAEIEVRFKEKLLYTWRTDSVHLQIKSAISLLFSERIENPQLWSPEKPDLYDFKIAIYANDQLVDIKEVRTGIRSIQLNENGFFLNGNQRFINGTNRHQEYPYIGYALSDKAQFRDAYEIKKAGFDFVRMSHYPHAEAFMNACDELGLMVMNCIPGWQRFEEGDFAEQSYREIQQVAKRDRNHPSIIFWENSLNESGMSEEYMNEANRVLRLELPFEDVYTAGWIDHRSYDLFIPARQHAKPPFYWNKYNNNGRKLLIAEYGDWEYYAQNAGFNQKNYANLKEEERSSRQLRGYGEKRLIQQALNYEEAFNSNKQGINTIGHANWLMFDYNRGYSKDLESSGISDIFRIPKPAYYFYRSQKKPANEPFSEPMVHIANYWKKNSPLKIKVYSNCDSVSLSLNGNLIETRNKEKSHKNAFLDFPPFTFQLGRYEKGILYAVGYLQGKKVATHAVRTPKRASTIKLEAGVSGKPITPNTPDLVFVYAKILDENGVLVTDATNIIDFEIPSLGSKIIGPNRVRAEAGIATILVRTYKETSDSLTIVATSKQLEKTELKIF